MFGGGGGGSLNPVHKRGGGGRVAESCAQTAEEIKESAWEFHSIMFPGALG